MESLKRFIEYKQHAFKYYENMNIFKVCESFSNNLFTIIEHVDALQNLCLPFEQCFISFDKSYVYQNLESSYTMDNLCAYEVDVNTITFTTLVRQFNGYQETYIPIVFDLLDGVWRSDTGNKQLTQTRDGSKLYWNVVNVAKKVLKKLISRQYIYVKNDTKIDIKYRDIETRKMNRVKYKPKQIIYISDKKTFKKEHFELSNKIINKPEHSWEVMGFYRKLKNPNSLGKNRQGKYILEGYTWVIPHIRGEGKLIKKVRVIK